MSRCSSNVRARTLRRRGRVRQRDPHAEVVVNGPPPRVQQQDARSGVGRRHELSHHAMAARAGVELHPAPQLAPEAAAGGVGPDGDEQVRSGGQGIGDQLAARVLHDPGVALEVDLGRAPLRRDVGDRHLGLAPVGGLARAQQRGDAVRVVGRGCAQHVPGRDGRVHRERQYPSQRDSPPRAVALRSISWRGAARDGLTARRATRRRARAAARAPGSRRPASPRPCRGSAARSGRRRRARRRRPTAPARARRRTPAESRTRPRR